MGRCRLQLPQFTRHTRQPHTTTTNNRNTPHNHPYSTHHSLHQRCHIRPSHALHHTPCALLCSPTVLGLARRRVVDRLRPPQRRLRLQSEPRRTAHRPPRCTYRRVAELPIRRRSRPSTQRDHSRRILQTSRLHHCHTRQVAPRHHTAVPPGVSRLRRVRRRTLLTRQRLHGQPRLQPPTRGCVPEG